MKLTLRRILILKSVYWNPTKEKIQIPRAITIALTNSLTKKKTSLQLTKTTKLKAVKKMNMEAAKKVIVLMIRINSMRCIDCCLMILTCMC